MTAHADLSAGMARQPELKVCGAHVRGHLSLQTIVDFRAKATLPAGPHTRFFPFFWWMIPCTAAPKEPGWSRTLLRRGCP